MNEVNAFTLACRDSRVAPPVLCGVEAAGRLDGTLFELKLRQTYRNAGTTPLEVVYTFPLLPRGVLLGFGTELNGARMDGAILPRRQAEKVYEGALADGDAPVMLEAHADGLHTANIGNLNPGDEIVVELRMVQLVAFEQGRLRLAIPATIAPRYGDPARGGLQPQQAPAASLTADYPLALTLQIAGVLADAGVECPTHRVVSQRTDAGLALSLAPQARLDRDVVVIVTPASAADALVVQSHDAHSTQAPTVLLAALPVPDAPLRERIALKLLVDCSGSMGGDSMASARRALNGIAARLGSQDVVSLTRFGSTVQHVFALAACEPKTLARLAQDIAKTEADLGGTEMEGALNAVFALKAKRSSDEPADVLLITDGEVWQVDAIIETARRSAQRVFVIGVGSSPAEGMLRRLAEATGGACEFATPGEALEAAAARMLARIRQQAWRDLRIDWGAEVAWQGQLPLCAFAGDTLAVFAGVRDAAGAPVRLIARTAGGVDITLTAAATRTVAADDALPRVAAAQRLVALDAEAATALALDYQLMSPYTNCVLVHQRAAADKTVDEARLHQVEGMLAAGWGATGSVLEQARGISMSRVAAPMAAMAGGAAPRKLRKMVEAVASLAMPDAPDAACLSMDMGRVDSELCESVKPVVPFPGPLAGLADDIAEHLWKRSDLPALMALLQPRGIAQAVRDAIAEIVALGVSDAQAWALLVRWLDARAGTNVFDSAPAALQLRIQRLDAVETALASSIFERQLVAVAASV
jgi:Ca-activated chloride channel family protein